MMKDTEVLNNIIDPFYWKFLRELSKMEYNFEQAIISLSPDQLKCKKWLADELKKIRGSFLPFDNTIIQLYGGWLGYPLIDFLEDSIGIGLLENIDLDKKALKAFAKMCYYKNKKYKATYGDVKTIEKTPDWERTDLVINTSSEHMADLPELIANKKYIKTCIFALQSNNMFYVDDHINCSISEDDFVKKSGLSRIIYKGTKVMSNDYERYMVIGLV